MLYLLIKEFKQMMRNRLLPIVFILLPVLMMNAVPRIATQEVRNLGVAVVDRDHSSLSARIVHKLSSSPYFNLYASPARYAEAMSHLQAGDVDFIVTIEPGFEQNLYRTGPTPHVMCTVNAVNGMKGGLGNSYLTQIVSQYAAELREEEGLFTTAPVIVSPRYLFNPTLDYKPYMIPALVAMMLILLVGFLPALNVVGEREHGTIEQINVSPVKPLEFILSKMIPYWTVGIAITLLAMLLAWRIHGVAPAGSVGTLIAFNILYILTISSLGLTISNYSDTMRQAAIVMFFFIVIFILTSGLITPISSMPHWAQRATLLNPLRYIITAMREVYLKGSTFGQLIGQFLPLCLYAAAATTWAIVSYKKNE